jgi:acyl-coenzyme A synthetase/AMP-(fatty) acid ligase
MARYCFENAAENTPDKIALRVISDLDITVPDRDWTYSALNQQVRRIGGALLDRGIHPGDRLLIRMDNCPEYALLFFGALAAGIIPIPASSQLSGREVDFILNDSGARAVALSSDLNAGDYSPNIQIIPADDITLYAAEGSLIDWADSLPDDPAYLIYTSGTTSSPKGVLHAHWAAWGRRPMYRDWYDLDTDDTMLHAGAFNWTYTLGVGLTDPWANGATSIVYTGAKDAKDWPEIIRRSGATIFAAVPTVYRQILKYCDQPRLDLGSLRHGLTAGEPLPDHVAEGWLERTGTKLYEAFGMSEISTYISSSPRTVPPRPGSPGKPQTGRNVVILDPTSGTDPLAPGENGVIAVDRSDPGMMLGYWNRPQEEAAAFRDSWFITGDRASMDKDGYIWLDGRSDDLMNAFGYRVSPMEVESVLGSHPHVAEIAVAECAVSEDISIIAAFIVLHAGQPTSGMSDDILEYAKSRLADYKQPREIVFVDALPRTANGKIQRRELVLP